MSAGGLAAAGAAGRGTAAASATSLGGSSGSVRPVAASPGSGANKLAAPIPSAVSLGSGPIGGAPARGLAASATSLGGSSGTVRPIAASTFSGTGKPAASANELGASTRSLRALLESSEAASSQSLNSLPAGRRK